MADPKRRKTKGRQKRRAEPLAGAASVTVAGEPAPGWPGAGPDADPAAPMTDGVAPSAAPPKPKPKRKDRAKKTVKAVPKTDAGETVTPAPGSSPMPDLRASTPVVAAHPAVPAESITTRGLEAVADSPGDEAPSSVNPAARPALETEPQISPRDKQFTWEAIEPFQKTVKAVPKTDAGEIVTPAPGSSPTPDLSASTPVVAAHPAVPAENITARGLEAVADSPGDEAPPSVNPAARPALETEPQISPRDKQFTWEAIEPFHVVVLFVLLGISVLVHQWWSIKADKEPAAEEARARTKEASPAPEIPSAAVPPPAPVAPTILPPGPSGESAAHIAGARLMDAFWKAPTWRDKLPYVRDRDRVAPLMRAFYEERREREPSGAALTMNELIRIGRHELLHLAYARPDTPAAPVLEAALLKQPDGTWLLDWESFTGAGEMGWSEFQETRPTKPTLFRAYARQDGFFGGEFTDTAKFLCVRLTSADGGHQVYAYCDKDSVLGGTAALVLASRPDAGPVTVRIAFPPDPQSHNCVRLVELVANRWLLLE